LFKRQASSIFLIPFIGVLCIGEFYGKGIGDFFYIFFYNEFLMRFQINEYYKLGAQTKDFVEFLNGDVKSNKTNKKYKYKSKFLNYNSTCDFVFESDETICDYLKIPDNVNLHDEILKKLEKNRLKKALKTNEHETTID